MARAIALAAMLRAKHLPAALAVPQRWGSFLGPTAVRVQRRSAIRADDLKVLQPVVIPDAVDVIEDHPHWLAAPDLTLPT
jgi:hypothetical protein